MESARVKNEIELNEIYHLGKIHQPKGATVVFGGQAGSEGKGAIAGYLARKYEWGASICNFMPNAGHTWQEGDEKVVVSQLPVALVSPTVGKLMIGPGAAIDVQKLLAEIERYDDRYDVASRLWIHPRAMVITDEHKEWEGENLLYIASTGKGCGAALAAKIRREQSVVLAKDVMELQPFIADVVDFANDLINAGRGVLVEGAQGFDLDINHGYSYPYCTSRQCTPAQVLADSGIDGRLVTHSIAVVRTKPIRVGNVEHAGKQVGYSGDYGTPEMKWDQVSVEIGRMVEEKTTVTGRTRRIFEFDFDRVAIMSHICRPTAIALTFADYLDQDIYGLGGDQGNADLYAISPALSRFAYKLERAVGRSVMRPRVKLTKTGPDDSHIIDYLRI